MALFHIETQGCKVNLADSMALHARLCAAGHRPAADAAAADLLLVNTCTVTGAADADARQLVERLRRTNRSAELVVTGCLAEVEPERLRSWPGVNAVAGNRDKSRLLPLLGLAADGEFPDAATATLWDAPTSYPLFRDAGHTRAFVKVQDGCDAACSFCIIPSTRGRARSLALDQVVATVRALGDDGAREVVLTGIHLGHWGRDRGSALPALLDALAALERPQRIRLSSIEPNELSAEIVERVAGSERFAPHFHLPLQSGSDPVLARMRRPYDVARYVRAVELIARRIPSAGIGADVIAAFPGESERDFEATRALLRSLPITYLHPFRWSPRKGTPAASLGGRVSPAIATLRGRSLRALGRELEHRQLRALAGKEELALTLKPRPNGARALTGRFVHVHLRQSFAPNEMIAVRMDGLEGGRALATPIALRETTT